MTRRWRQACSAAYWLTPSLFCLAAYWLGLKVWFQQDDFAWLGLPLQVHGARDLLRALFEPYAQGTIRFLSERGFFLVFTSIFGIDPLPFRIWVFLTQCGNLILLSSITGRLTRSRLAGFAAPVLWMAGSALAVPMSWTSAYNEVLFAFCLLLAFHWLLRYFETGKRSYYIAQWIAFLAGLGALELMVVYPALATLYVLCCARQHLRKLLPLFIASVLYSILHLAVAPIPATGPYAMHYDWRILRTFTIYWKLALGPARLPEHALAHRFPGAAGTVLLTLGILVFTLWKIRRREWLAIFFLGWYAIVLLPLLPLPDHITDFYLTVPTLGLAMLGAWALVSSGAGPRPAMPEGRSWTCPTQIAALLLVAIYLASNLAVTRSIVRWRYDRGREARSLVAGVLEAHRLHPDKMILLDGVSPQLFAEVVWDSPFRLFGISEVYLTPEAAARIQAHPLIGDVASCTLPAGPVLRALDRDQAVVYDVRGERLKNVTANYLATIAGAGDHQGAGRVELANPAFAGQLGPGWYGPENGYRWMAQAASLTLVGPAGCQTLLISGYAPAQLVARGPVRFSVTLNGTAFPKMEIDKPDSPFEFTFRLPALPPQKEVPIFLEVDRTFTPPGETRKLGAAISAVEMR